MDSTFSRLRANGLASPLGVAAETIRLTWVADRDLGEADSIVVELATDVATLIEDRAAPADIRPLPRGERSLTIPRPTSRRLFWRVGHRHADGTAWSAPSDFSTSFDFTAAGAEWVTHPEVADGRPMHDARSVWFALDIETNPSDVSTLLHLAAPGVVDVRVDGRSVSERVLGPGYSELKAEAAAVTYDLGRLASGPHIVTVEVASGPYWISPTSDRYAKFTGHHQPPRLLAAVEQLGVRATVTATGASTRTGRGATLAAHWYGGEDFDAGAPEPWDDPAHLDAVGAAPSQPVSVWWPEHPPLAVVEVRESTDRRSGRHGSVWDFGVNIAGIPAISWRPADADRVVQLYPAELVDADGVDQDSTGSPIVDSIRIPAGSDGEWAPRFGYHGFRYVEMRGADDDVRLHARVIRATNETAGGFTSADQFLERLHVAIDRAVQGNMHSVFTDCPHREKLGWLEQLHFCFDALARNYDVEAHLRDMLHHVRIAQLPTGAIPNIVPEFVDFSGHGFLGDDDAFRFDVNWGGIVVHLPLDHYRQYGDLRVITENIGAIRSYLSSLRSREVDGLIDFGLGDWIALDVSTPRELIASHGYLRILDSAATIAGLIGDETWREELRARSNVVSAALRRYETARQESGQTALVILIDLAERRGDQDAADLAFEALLERIAADGDAFTVGEVTFGLLVETLQRRGHGETVHRIITREDVPGYGMQLARGITALAETWSAERRAVGEGSNNHFMLGMIDHWLHRHVAGLRQSPDSVGWQMAVVAPTFLAGVPSAASWHASPRGTYSVDWVRQADGSIRVDLTVPSDGMARVEIPGIAAHVVGGGSFEYRVERAIAGPGGDLVGAHD